MSIFSLKTKWSWLLLNNSLMYYCISAMSSYSWRLDLFYQKFDQNNSWQKITFSNSSKHFFGEFQFHRCWVENRKKTRLWSRKRRFLIKNFVRWQNLWLSQFAKLKLWLITAGDFCFSCSFIIHSLSLTSNCSELGGGVP